METMYKKILNIINTDITLNKNLKILLSIFAILFSNVPLYIYLFSIDIIEANTLILFVVKSYPFSFFYLFCFTIFFHTDVLKIKVIVMTFLSFLLVSLLLFSFHFMFNYVTMPPYDSEDFYVIINNLVFVPCIFFIIMIISYINFDLKDTKKLIYKKKKIGYVDCVVTIGGTRNKKEFKKIYDLSLLIEYQQEIVSIYEIDNIILNN